MHSIIDPNTGKIWEVKDEVALDEEDQRLFLLQKLFQVNLERLCVYF